MITVYLCYLFIVYSLLLFIRLLEILLVLSYKQRLVLIANLILKGTFEN